VKHTKVTICGKVQGVNYRHSAKVEADRLGVKGFIKNEANGDVYLEIEGEEEQLNKMIRWCRIGPAKSRVSEIYFNDGEAQNFSSFVIQN
jgi:acylphosphatase